MRQIRITSKRCVEAEDRTILQCPIISGGGRVYFCTDKCVWFRVEYIVNKEAHYVFCGDKLIGEIKEKEKE